MYDPEMNIINEIEEINRQDRERRVNDRYWDCKNFPRKPWLVWNEEKEIWEKVCEK